MALVGKQTKVYDKHELSNPWQNHVYKDIMLYCLERAK